MNYIKIKYEINYNFVKIKYFYSNNKNFYLIVINESIKIII